MTIELARFTVHEGAETQLLAERPAMVDALRHVEVVAAWP